MSIALACAAALAHSEAPPPPRPPVPPPTLGAISWAKPLRWSWLHWWEANRDPYLVALRQGDGQRSDPAVVDAYRGKAVDALIAAARSGHPQTRVAVAIALGRIGDPTAYSVLRMLADDPSEPVAMAARVGMGLLDCPEARRFLVEPNHPGDRLLEAAIVGYGLTAQDNADAQAGLQRLVGGPAVGQATAAAWALRCHGGSGSETALHPLLNQTTSVWLASEALLALGQPGRTASVGGLAHLLNQTETGRRLPVWAELQDKHNRLMMLARRLEAAPQTSDTMYQDYLDRLEAWNQNNPSPMKPSPRIEGRQLTVILGVEKIYQARLRASAAAALGEIGGPAAVAALLEALQDDDDDYSDLVKGFVIMALGRTGDERALGPLVRLLRGSPDRRVQMSTGDKESPLRGYAALALGLYARPVATPQGSTDRARYYDVCQVLAQRLADREETAEVRAAAAMGLGLTGRTEILKLLIPACDTIRSDEEVLVGYALLARAMVGDAKIVAPARQFLAVANDRTDMAGILARRAGVLAVGVLGRDEGIPILIDTWELNYWVNREATVAFSLCRAYNTTDTFVRLLERADNPLEQAFFVRCLGELFTRERPSRLSLLTRRSNYTMKNDRLLDFQTLANEFLFAYLIPSFEGTWR
ncbi:MAG: hypothetical protein GX591_17365 [Planctomycetes bacterium]|nr:hypothetical protein [Planctomycetota bacterium]